MTRKTGTREWSDVSVNVCRGCAHGCLYCYARANALRFGRIKTGEEWTDEQVNAEAANRARRKYSGIVMFPTTHDVTKGTAAVCLGTLVNLLDAGNEVLVVSKAGPHVPMLLDAARSLTEGRGTLELRVSVTCLDPAIAAFWEPGAPTPKQRLDALYVANQYDIPTSVSIEPLLEPEGLDSIIEAACDSGVRGEIWIGVANELVRRTAWCKGRPGLENEVRRIEHWRTRGRMHGIYRLLKDDPQIRWKDSYQKPLGIDALGRKV